MTTQSLSVPWTIEDLSWLNSQSVTELDSFLSRMSETDRQSTLLQWWNLMTPQEAIREGRRLVREKNDPSLLIKTQWPKAVFDHFQWDMIRSIFDPTIRELYVKGCTASGKTAVVGMIVCAYFDAYDDAKVVLTSSTFDHVQSVLFGEVARWYNAMRFKPEGSRLLNEGVACNEGHYVDCVNPSYGEAFSGRHSRHTLFTFDEATGVADERFLLADTQATKFIALANPRTLSGRFRLAFNLCANPNGCETVLAPYGYRRCITVDGQGVLNVREKRLENAVGPIGGITIRGRVYRQGQPISEEDYETVKPLVPGQLCYDTFLGHCANPDRRWVNTFARGWFPDEDPQVQVILTGWLDRHISAWQQAKPAVTCFGLDVADSEFGDETVLAAGGPAGCRELHVRRKTDLMETCAWVLATGLAYGINLKRGDVPVVVDSDGLGKGIADRLHELGVKVVYYRGNDTPEDKKRYVNRRAEAYSILGSRLDPDGTWAATPWALPEDALLRQDLCAPEKIFDSDGFRFKLTPKSRQPGMPANRATLAEKLGRSPDRGDAVVCLYWGVHMGDNIAPTGIARWDISRATKHQWQLKLPESVHSVVAAVYQNPQRGRLAFGAIGLMFDPPRLRLLRCEQYKAELGLDRKADEVLKQCHALNVCGVAIDAEQNSWLADRMLDAGITFYHSPLDAALRRGVAGNLIRRFREGTVELFKDDELTKEIALLPIKEGAEGYALEDDESLVVMDRAMAFAIALHWASGTMHDYQQDPD